MEYKQYLILGQTENATKNLLTEIKQPSSHKK